MRNWHLNTGFENITTIKICVVPVRSTCASAKWYRRVSMNHLSVASRFPLVCDKKSEGKRDVFIMVSQHGVQLIQLSMKLSWHIQAPDNNIFRAESVTFTDFYVLPIYRLKKSEAKAQCLYKWFHNMRCNPAVNETLLTYPSYRQ